MKKLIKVTFEYENEIRELSGDEAQKWLDRINDSIVLQTMHEMPFPKFYWSITKKVKRKDVV